VTYLLHVHIHKYTLHTSTWMYCTAMATKEVYKMAEINCTKSVAQLCLQQCTK